MEQIRLTKGYKAKVSPEDAEAVRALSWRASIEGRGTKVYAVRFQGKKEVRMHRFIAERAFGAIPKGHVVDHLNHDPLDNRRENLAIITQSENMRRSEAWKKRKSF